MSCSPTQEDEDTETLYVRSAVLSLKRDAWHAIYHRNFGGLCLVDDAAKEVLDSFSKPQRITDGVLHGEDTSPEAKLIRQYILRNFLVLSQDSAQRRVDAGACHDPEGGKLKVVQLVVANACNFGCTYCFEGIQGGDGSPTSSAIAKDVEGRTIRRRTEGEVAAQGENTKAMVINLHDSVYTGKDRAQHQSDPRNRLMRPEAAIDYVAKSISLAKSSGVTAMVIQFFGGEPLLNWPAIEGVLKKFGHGDNFGVSLDYSIVTNGSLISEEVSKAFAQYNVAVCVSFDSPISTSRKLKNGESSIPLVIEGLRILRRFNNRVAINAALSVDTWDFCNDSLIEFASQQGVKEIGVVLDLSPSFYTRFGQDRIVERLWQLVDCGRRHGIVVTGYWHQIFQLLCGVDAVRPRGYKMCSAKGCQFSIEPNGSVFSCKGASGYFGTISEGERLLKTNAFQRHALLSGQNPEQCQGCDIEAFCSGFCLGPLEKKYGRIDVVETEICPVYKGITKKLIENVIPYEIPTFDLTRARQNPATLHNAARSSN